MSAPDIATSSKEERQAFIKEQFRCKGECRECGNCAFLRGRIAEDLYTDYIEGKRSFTQITIAHREAK